MFAAMLSLGWLATPAVAQDIVRPVRDGQIIIPSSSIERPADLGRRAHTNTILYVHNDSGGGAPGATFETPASIGCVYQIVWPLVAGCPIKGTTANPTGGSGAIAIVDAFDYPTAANDISAFSTQFGLPAANFQVVYATGTKPPQDPTGGWEGEAALDIEWAHAMAPQAQIILVEAASDTFPDMFYAVQIASNQVVAAGGGEVSMSWGESEGSTESSEHDSLFTTSGVVYFAATGDFPFTLQYPSVSPNVIAAGGTSLQRDKSGNFTGEVYWDNLYGGGGGGLSKDEARPAFQNGIQALVGTSRGVPDVSSDADPNSGVAIYDSTAVLVNGQSYSGWMQFGGTSAAAPTLAGRANAQGDVNVNTSSVLTEIYTDYANAGEYAAEFRDITQSNANCKIGWDICDGVGSPLGDFSLSVGGRLITVRLPELVWVFTWELPRFPTNPPCYECPVQLTFNPTQLQWTYTDPTQFARAPAPAPGSNLTGYSNPLANTDEVFYLTTSDSLGNLGVEQIYTYGDGDWYSGNLTVNVDAHPATASSSLVGYIDSTANSDNLFYLGTDQHVHALIWSPTGGWSTTDVTTDARTSTLAEGTVMAAHLAGQGSSQRQEVFYFGSDDHVHELWRLSQSLAWHSTDITLAARAPSPFVGSPLTGFYDSLSGYDTVFYLASDHHVHELIGSSSGAWGTVDLTAQSGAPTVPTGGSLAAHLNTIAGSEEVYFVTPYRNVQVLWSQSTGTPGWHTYNVNAAAGSPAYPLTTSTLSTDINTAVNPPRDEVYYLGSDQHVHELFANGVWNYADVTAQSGAPNSVP